MTKGDKCGCETSCPPCMGRCGCFYQKSEMTMLAIGIPTLIVIALAVAFMFLKNRIFSCIRGIPKINER